MVLDNRMDSMNASQRSVRVRAGRAALGLVMSGALMIAGFWAVQAARPGLAMAFVQVPSDKAKVTPEEIMSRFPKEKHEEFMRRAIANSRKAGVQYKTGGAFGAVIVDPEGNVIADGLNHVVAQNDPTWHA